MKKYLSNQKGVTLIELLAVIVILGILAAIAVPAVMTQIDDAKVAAGDADKAVIIDAADRYYLMDGAEVSVKISTLVSGGYLKSVPKGYNGNDTVAKDGTITKTP